MIFLVNLKLLYVNDLDQDSKLMTSTVDLQVTWKDTSLAWFTKVVKELPVSKDKVWHPHISIDNAVGNVKVVDAPDLIMKKEGEVTMRKRIYMSTICDDVDETKTYNCSIKIGTDLYDSKMVTFANTSMFDANNKTLADRYLLMDVATGFNAFEKIEDSNTTYPQFIATVIIQDTGSDVEHAGVTSLTPMAAVLFVSFLLSCVFAQYKS